MFFFTKKFLCATFIVLILLLILIYVVNINSIPDNIILFNNDDLALETIAGIKVKKIDNSKDKNSDVFLTNSKNDINTIRTK